MGMEKIKRLEKITNADDFEHSKTIACIEKLDLVLLRKSLLLHDTTEGQVTEKNKKKKNSAPGLLEKQKILGAK